MNMNEKPVIYDYNNFRAYLCDYYDYRHSVDQEFTKAYICKKLGLSNTRSYCGDSIAGKTISSLKISLFIKLVLQTFSGDFLIEKRQGTCLSFQDGSINPV